MIELREPSLFDLYDVMGWRNSCMETLRTPTKTTMEMQNKFYYKLKESTSMLYYAIYDSESCVGLVGLTDISPQYNKNAEISLIIDSKLHGKGIGSQTVSILLDIAFNALGLTTIYGECYECNKNIGFWKKITKKYDGVSCVMPMRKIWDEVMYDSLYFVITKEGYNKCAS